MSKRKLLDIVGVVLMGDALVNLLHGRRHIRLWQGKAGSRSPYGRAAEYLQDHPLVYGAIPAVEFAIGAMLTQGAEEPAPEMT